MAKGGRSVVTMMRSWGMGMRAVRLATAPHKKSTGSARRQRVRLPHGELPAMATALAPIPSTRDSRGGTKHRALVSFGFPARRSLGGSPLLRRTQRSPLPRPGSTHTIS